jgi:ADP-heptose:LPS heptosyltransferase
VVERAGATDMATLADVIAGAEAIVVGNTGPAHLAAAVGTPVVSLFAPTVPLERWHPWRVPYEALFVAVPCAGCRARTCPVAGHPCLAGVEPAAALAAVRRVATREAVPA